MNLIRYCTALPEKSIIIFEGVDSHRVASASLQLGTCAANQRIFLLTRPLRKGRKRHLANTFHYS